MPDIFQRIFSTIARKIFFAFGLVLLISGGIFVYVAHRTGFSMLEEQAREKAHDITAVSNAVLMSVMAEGKPVRLGEFLQALNSSPGVAEVVVVNRQGIVFCSTDSLQKGKKFNPGGFTDLSRTTNEQFIATTEQGASFEYVVTPIEKTRLCYRCHLQPEPNRGYLAVKLSMDKIRATTLKHRTTNIFMIVGTFLGVGGVILLALFLIVVRPIAKLHRQIKQLESQLDRVERGEQVMFPQLQIPSSKDEMRDLIVAFNRLTHRLNEVHDRLHELHQKELEHADRLASAGEMAASVAHEIKNPVAGVLGALQVFQSEAADTDPKKEILGEMKIQLERVNHAVNDLLSYARPATPVLEELPIHELIQKTVSLLRQQIKGKEVTIDLNLSRENLIVYADRKQIQQVLWNIGLNALQAMRGKGALSISTSRDDSIVRIRVRDTGVGIPPELLESVFKPFFTTKHKGTGLGMTISRRIMEQHNGSVDVKSTVNEGTTVTLLIPFHANHD